MKTICTVALVLALTASIQAQTVTNWAGKAKTSGGITGGEDNSQVRFNLPWDMAMDANGNLFITNEGSHAIYMRMKSDSKYYVRAGKQGFPGYKNDYGINAQFDQPRGIAIGSKIYVADAGNHTIRQIDLFTSISTAQQVGLLAGSAGNSGHNDANGSSAIFDTPTDVAIDSKGNIYVADAGNHCIRVITPGGVVTTYAGQPGTAGSANGDRSTKAEFNYPTGLFIDANDNVYVADNNNNRIRLISQSTGLVSTSFNDLFTPQQVLVDSAGNIFASGACQIRALMGTDTLVVGNHFRNCGYKNASDTIALLDNARGIIQVSASEYLFCDMNNHVIRKIAVDPCASFSASIAASGPLRFCQGGQVVLSGLAGATNIWTWPGNTYNGKDLKVTQKAWYKLAVSQVKGGSSCDDTTGIFVAVAPRPNPTIEIEGETEFCDGDQVKLHVLGSYASFKWSTNETTATIVVKSSGTYYYDAVNAKGCSGSSDSVEVLVHSLPPVPDIAAQGDSLYTTLKGDYFYAWYYYDTFMQSGPWPYYKATANGVYKLWVIDSLGCMNESDTLHIVVISLPQVGKFPVVAAYPNPSTGAIRIEGGESGRFVIMDVAGHELAHGQIPARANLFLPAGQYFLRVEGDNGHASMSKIVIIR
ncbi:MAG: T9SS type A sorting domain-containing protein [Bacteroidetes bacterium]|jgi:hypothetical protein|nr:T9SS type A sorting domain-containing protein [Bacteroidota bacterium]